MNLLGNEVSPRETVLMGVTLLVVIIVGVYYYSRTVQGSTESPQEFYFNLDASAYHLETSLAVVSKMSRTMNLGNFQLPSTEDSAKVLSHIDKVARASGLAFPTLSATAPKKGRKFQVINYRFTTNGDLNALIKFIDEIQKGVYLVCLENWDMKPTEDGKKITANLSLRAYFSPLEGSKKS
jgi:Tfp pilus assembly protein PilO